jgi:uncharacterized membrane protein YhhN
LSVPAAMYVFAALAGVALGSADDRRPKLYGPTKIATSLSLLFVVGLPENRFATAIFVGLIFSAFGDVALLFKDRTRPFLTGVVFFLVAHAAYAAAFVSGVGSFSVVAAAIGAALAAAASLLILRQIWSNVSKTLRGPFLVYGAAISTMCGCAAAFFAGSAPGPIRTLVLAGAVLFYLGDSALALNHFGKRLRYGQTISMAFYWSGQLAFALATG